MSPLTKFLEVDFSRWLADLGEAQNGFPSHIERNGTPAPEAPQLLLVQARMLFSLCHLALQSEGRTREALICRVAPLAAHMARYKRTDGLYGATLGGAPLCYDQSFVLLALAAWQRVAPDPERLLKMEEIWRASDALREQKSGLFWDGVMPLAQNPQMHFYEALLEAYVATNSPLWLERAVDLRTRAMARFFDASNGSLAEFDGSPRREPGHQYEWAWLLLRENDLAANPALVACATQLAEFAERFGHARSGPLNGAVRDAVTPEGGVIEESYLLWPQTEAIKYFAVTQRHEEARGLMELIFKQWFGGQALWCNQIGPKAEVLQPQTYTRLFYHLVLAITEGARTGAWPGGFRA